MHIHLKGDKVEVHPYAHVVLNSSQKYLYDPICENHNINGFHDNNRKCEMFEADESCASAIKKVLLQNC